MSNEFETPDLFSMANHNEAWVPKSMITGAFFASTPQKGAREFEIKGVKWTIGGKQKILNIGEVPALDQRHGKLLFILMSQFKVHLKNKEDVKEIGFSLTELTHLYYRRDKEVIGKKEREIVRKLLSDLVLTPLRMENEDGTISTFHILNNPNYNEKVSRRDSAQMELFLESISLKDRFLDHLEAFESMMCFKLDVLMSLKHGMTAAMYMYMPSRAAKNTKHSPFEITLTTLLDQLGEKIPTRPAERKRKFVREDRGINVVEELDGLPTLKGKIRCTLTKTADEKDWKFNFWEERQTKKSKSKRPLKTAWIEAGNSEADFDYAVSNPVLLDPSEEESLEFMGIDLEQNHRMFMLSKALIGGAFTECVAETKYRYNLGKVPKPAGYLTKLIKESF